MLSPIAWRTPPRHYGPWEQVVSLLTEGLVRRGEDVTLFATGDSLTSARLQAVCPVGYEDDPTLDAKVWESLHISEVFERAGEFDLIHNHFDFLPLTYSRLTTTPVVATIHGFSSERILPVYRKYADTVQLRRHQRRRPRARPALRGHGLPRHRPLAASPSAPMPASTCCSSAASTPTRAPTRPSRSPARRGGGSSWPA